MVKLMKRVAAAGVIRIRLSCEQIPEGRGGGGAGELGLDRGRGGERNRGRTFSEVE